MSLENVVDAFEKKMGDNDSVLVTVALVVVGVLIIAFIFAAAGVAEEGLGNRRPPSKAFVGLELANYAPTRPLPNLIGPRTAYGIDRRSDEQRAADEALLSAGLIGYAPGTRGAAGYEVPEELMHKKNLKTNGGLSFTERSTKSPLQMNASVAAQEAHLLSGFVSPLQTNASIAAQEAHLLSGLL